MDEPRRSEKALGALPLDWLVPAALLLASGGWMLSLRRGFLLDDAYISMRYAINLAEGRGLVWNEGVPVEGYTNLLLVLALVPLRWAGVDLGWAALALSAGFSVGCLWLMARLSRRLRPGRSMAEHALPGLWLVSLPSFAHAATSGMEGPCFAFWLLLAADRLLLGRADGRQRLWAAFFLSLAYLTRPEGALVAAVVLGFEARSMQGPPAARLRALGPAGGLVAGVVAAHVAARVAYYGYPLPNTFYAKVIAGSTSVLRGIFHLAGFLLAGGWVALIGLGERKREGGARPWWSMGYAVAGVYVAYLLVVGGDHPVWYRFYMPLLPLPLLASAERLSRLFDEAREENLFTGILALLSAPARRASMLGTAAVIFLLSLPFSEPVASEFAELPEPVARKVHEFDRFFREEAPRGSLIAAGAVGYLAYRNPGHHILDVWGLNDAHIAHLDLPATVKFGHDKTDVVYVASRKPDYLLIHFSSEAAPIEGYDLCSRERFSPFLIYRRSTPLLPSEMGLGLGPGLSRPGALPPPCAP